nr:MAG TPA: hypothetical protein [Caudoviricetes sp.]DAU13706.1 MAG TPA: hypothetical protein [Bacteriophage sp.]
MPPSFPGCQHSVYVRFPLNCHTLVSAATS